MLAQSPRRANRAEAINSTWLESHCRRDSTHAVKLRIAAGLHASGERPNRAAIHEGRNEKDDEGAGYGDSDGGGGGSATTREFLNY